VVGGTYLSGHSELLMILKVEYYPPKSEGTGEAIDSSSSPEPSSDEDEDKAAHPKLSKRDHAHISDSLAALGVYARSMKPPKNWLLQSS
jgi:phosphatidylinositol phospholipase C, delta